MKRINTIELTERAREVLEEDEALTVLMLDKINELVNHHNSQLETDQAQRLVDKLVDHISLLLPLAKGYAANNRHAINDSIIRSAETTLENYKKWR